MPSGAQVPGTVLSSRSPFFVRDANTKKNSIAIISLKRDQQLPVILRDAKQNSEDAITNTRFGSYPHTTLLDKLWGSQIIATNVNATDTKRGRKRRREPDEEITKRDPNDNLTPEYEAATRGFAHILPPTPELWTVSLPHRTQVVYTPDYSFILQKLQARPGDTILEAGAGSGSFTHASARAVYNGIGPSGNLNLQTGHGTSRRQKWGRVCSFEYHEPRAEQLRQEIKDHGLDSVVKITHRDVYEAGFLLENGTSPRADVIFLDLPEPQRALQHLIRSPKDGSASPLNPQSASRLCTFSPCVEQVQQTIEALHRLGWVEIITFEVQHRRLDVRRDMTSLNYEGLRGVNASAANVEEAVTKLKEIDAKISQFHESSKAVQVDTGQVDTKTRKATGNASLETKRQRLERIRKEDKERKVWREGRLVHKTEQELKTHTSYLTFAILPRVWSQQDEERLQQKWFGANKTM